MSDRFITWKRNELIPEIEVTEHFTVSSLYYGWEVRDKENGEYSIVILHSPGQDLKTRWTIVLCQLDGTIHVRNGHTTSGNKTWEYLEKEIADLTAYWLPKYRINSEWEEDD